MNYKIIEYQIILKAYSYNKGIIILNFKKLKGGEMKSIVKIMISGIWMILSAQQMIWKYIYNWDLGDFARRVVYFSNQNIICAGGDSYDNITLSDIMFVGLDETGTPVWGPIFWGAAIMIF